MEKQLFNRVIMGAWVLLERHTLTCTCSYCHEERKVNTKIRIVLPKSKASNAWRRISYRNKDGSWTYLRSTLPKLSYFFGFVFTRWSNGFRLQILPIPFAKTNSLKALLTYAKSSCYKTRIKNVESLFWKSQVIFTNEDVGLTQEKTSQRID